MPFTVRTGSIDEAVAIQQKIPEFGKEGYTTDDYQLRLDAIDHLILIAESDGKQVGFKVGYDRYLDGRVFYSWLGGVLPEFRNKGVANLLLQKMEIWCKVKGFEYLKFKTMNRHRSMIRFAVAQRFHIVGFQQAEKSENSKIYFQKAL